MDQPGEPPGSIGEWPVIAASPHWKQSMSNTPADLALPSPSGIDPLLTRNRTFAEIALGDSAVIERMLNREDAQLLAALYANHGQPRDPAHIAAAFSRRWPLATR